MSSDNSDRRQLAPVIGRLFLTLLREQHDDGSLPNTPGINVTEHQKTRLTHHFIAALIACDCVSSPNLERALKWFMDLTPRATLGVPEMNQLEAFLRANFTRNSFSFEPPFDLMRQLIEMLIRQRDDGAYLIDGISAGSGPFASLWAIQVLDRAAEQNLLPDPSYYDQLKADAQAIVDYVKLTVHSGKSFVMHKDMALALRLRHKLHGDLEPDQLEILQKLLRAWHDNGGLWDVHKASLRPAVPEFLEHGIDEAIVGENERDWRNALVSTCYVIENFAALRQDFPEVIAPVDQTLDQLLGLFRHDSPDDLRRYFISEQGYIQIMCRLLAASQAWLGALSSHLIAFLADQTASARPDRFVQGPGFAIDDQGIIETLRKWIEVTYDGEPEPLTRGYSGARVVRVRPRLAIPSTGLRGQREQVALPGLESLVVKYGSPGDIETEVRNYRKLPPRLRERFVVMPEIIFNSGEKVFTVMQDLVGFEALEELLPKARRHSVEKRLGSALVDFLMTFHTLGMQPVRDAPVGLARRLYLEPGWRYLGTVFSLFHEPMIYQFLLEKGGGVVERAHDAELAIRALLTSLYSHEGTLNRFRASYMHGDLHIRNIMIRLTGDSDDPLLIRFIDLENVTADGDYAYDVGELRASLNLFRRETGEARLEQLATAIAGDVEVAYTALAQSNGDTLFPIRLALAESRAALRVAHGKSKEGRINFENGRVARAVNMLRDALKLVDDALESLRRGVQLLEAAPGVAAD